MAAAMPRCLSCEAFLLQLSPPDCAVPCECSTMMVKTACDLDEMSFSLVAPVVRFSAPTTIRLRISASLRTTHSDSLSTYTPRFLSSLHRLVRLNDICACAEHVSKSFASTRNIGSHGGEVMAVMARSTWAESICNIAGMTSVQAHLMVRLVRSVLSRSEMTSL